MKDLFSAQSALYQQARPIYPVELIKQLLPYVPAQQCAWDCGAGSGQLTQLLAPHFQQVMATDISAKQLAQAPILENVQYSVQSAEQTDFPAQHFDLISVAQAIHWFDFEKFYAEVRCTLKPAGLLAVIGYGLIRTDQQRINQFIDELYREILKGYWDAERHYIDEGYRTIPFPFQEYPAPELNMHFEWSVVQLIAYLNTWSAVQHFQRRHQQNPVDLLLNQLQDHDLQKKIQVHFPILLRLGHL